MKTKMHTVAHHFGEPLSRHAAQFIADSVLNACTHDSLGNLVPIRWHNRSWSVRVRRSAPRRRPQGRPVAGARRFSSGAAVHCPPAVPSLRLPRARLGVARSSRHGFTLVELLVVIAIIGILASMLFPALARMKVAAQVRKAQMQIGQIAQAIQNYEKDYTKFPVSSGSDYSAVNAMNAAANNTNDFTYGTVNLKCAGAAAGTFAPGPGFLRPGGVASTDTLADDGRGYQTNNSEVMAILLDMERLPNGQPTLNLGHVKNPKMTKYLSANLVNDTVSSGIGQDLVYRDPWGNPYIITIDLNYDDKARDAFYKLQKVSQKTSGSPIGYNGLINSHTPPNPPNGNNDYYEFNGSVMVWSAGPDKMIDPTVPANQGANKDNVVSWK